MKAKTKLRIARVLIPGLAGLFGFTVYQTQEWKAPPEAEESINPFTGSMEASKGGQKIYLQNCVVCHGERGKGDGMAAISLHPHPTNLVSQKVASQSDGALFWKISEGRTPMPSYKNSLTDEQRWQLVTYLRTLQAK